MKFKYFFSLSITIILLLTTPYAYAIEDKITVIFDQGHDQRFLIEKSDRLHLSKFAELFLKHGFKILSTDSAFTKDLLSQTNVLISSGPFKSFSKTEIKEIFTFIENGGTFCLMLHILHPVTNLLQD